MPVEPVQDHGGLYVVDTLMLGMEGQTAAFVVDGEETLLVDAGLPADSDVVLDALGELGVDSLDHILVTHVHLDHAGGVSYVAEEHPEATVLAHPNSVPYLTRDDELASLVESTERAMGPLAEMYGDARTVPGGRVREVGDGDVLDLGSHEIEVLHTPGHAPHHVSLYERVTEALFVVDEGCVYMDGELLPTTPPSDFDLDKTLESLERFMEYDAGVLLYGHYGANPDGGDALPRHAEVLEEWVAGIRDAWQRYGEKERVVEEVLERYEEERSLGGVEREILKRDVHGVLIYLERTG